MLCPEIALLRKSLATQAEIKRKDWGFFKKNSDTQNSLPTGGVIMSGGNFHGEYPAKALDFLAVGITELASNSENFFL